MRRGFLQRAARRVVSGYPKPWRQRYEVEVLDLLDASPARLRDVIDLARGQVVERLRSAFEPGDRPVLLATLVALVASARALAMAAPPIMAGWAAHQWLGPLPREVAILAFPMYVGLMFVLIAVRGCRKYFPAVVSFESGKLRLSERAGWIYLGLAMPIAFLMSWSSDHILQALGPLWMFAPVWEQFAARRPWQVEMARAVAQMRTARHHLKWAVMELERCEALVADGFPAPIEKAQEVIARLVREEKDALATLHSLGYRARLTSPALRTSNDEPNLNTN